MRATIEIPDHLRATILALAARKGYRGYSRVIVEALEYYLRNKASEEDGLKEVLALKGAWSQKTAEDVRSRIELVRANWDPERR